MSDNNKNIQFLHSHEVHLTCHIMLAHQFQSEAFQLKRKFVVKLNCVCVSDQIYSDGFKHIRIILLLPLGVTIFSYDEIPLYVQLFLFYVYHSPYICVIFDLILFMFQRLKTCIQQNNDYQSAMVYFRFYFNLLACCFC